MRTAGCKMLISFNGIYDISDFIDGFVPNKSFDAYFGSSKEDKKFASLLFYVPDNAPYCILTYSTGDYLVDPTQIKIFENALRAKGANIEILLQNFYAHAGFIGEQIFMKVQR